MSDSEILFLPEVNSLLNERDRIHIRYRQPYEQIEKLHSLPRQLSEDDFPVFSHKRSLADGTPVTELAAVMTTLEQSHVEHHHLKVEIHRLEQEIADLPRSRHGLINLVFVLVIVLLMVWLLLSLLHH